MKFWRVWHVKHMVVVVGVLVVARVAPAVEPVAELGVNQRLETIYAARCASCHDKPTGRIPPRSMFAFVPPNIIIRTLTLGTMKPMAAGLSKEDIAALADLLSALPNRESQSLPATCAESMRDVAIAPTDWPGTSRDHANTRFQPQPGIFADDVARLELAWTFAIPGGASGSPVIADGRIFISSGSGTIAAIDAERRCTVWTHDQGRIVRTLTLAQSASVNGESRIYYSDDLGFATALSAATGAVRWKTQVEEHPLSRGTAAPTVAGGRVFVPMSSIEDPLTHNSSHTCCTSRGSVTALDAQTGERIWKQYAIANAPEPLETNKDGIPTRFGPAGASIYTPLAFDEQRGRVYATTAESYTDDNPPGAYSVIAFDAATGARVWERQLLPTPKERGAICEENGWTDCRNLFSMGTSVSIHRGTDSGSSAVMSKDVLVVGQKSGEVYALDPDARGETVWEAQIAKGGDMGGIMYGVATDGESVFVPVSDLYAQPPARPGDLVAIDPLTGKTRWRAKQPEAECSWGTEGCVGAQVAAPTAIPGAVFTSSWDGHVRAYATSDGSQLWDFDTARAFTAVNGTANGGQISAYPVQVVNGTIYVTSGASSQTRPGNALLVFRVPE